ncbi:low molecular weight protein-tyrosine-phosphatase [Cellulomonas timonensis]|uniref:low molecular weight protein-tyrosine-phosphatase n=1 Tax=Cellulomonas timonensis TaxID=1689271 RepID=UPI000B2C1F9C|nr:low molecular weight protein-tyrosine-phosphatase [Cellulomonas timonensis]
MSTPYRIMTVCTGNICRSPMAEVVLRQRFEDAGLGDRVVIDSTGISDEEHGNPIDRRAATVLAAHGYEVPNRRARQVTAADLRERDLVLAMTSVHERSLRRLAGASDVARRIHRYREFDPTVSPQAPDRELDVADPWYGDMRGFEECLAMIELAADTIVAHVRDQVADRAVSGRPD